MYIIVIMKENESNSIVMRVRFPEYLYEWIKQKAKKEKRSMAQQINYYIDNEYIEEKGEGDVQLVPDLTGEEGGDADNV